MNKKFMLVILAVSAISCSLQAEKSTGQKTAEAIKSALTFVKALAKNTANLPTSTANYFGYWKELSTTKQFGAAATFWIILLYALKKAHETYKTEQAKREIKRVIDEITEQIGKEYPETTQR